MGAGADLPATGPCHVQRATAIGRTRRALSAGTPRLTAMHTRPRRSLLVIPVLGLTLAACGPGGGSSAPAATVAEVSARPTATTTPTATQAPSTEPTTGPASQAPASPVVGQTDTEWGRIWDAVPAGFPRYPGATTADDASPDPVSATYVVAQGDAATIARWMQTNLEQATYSTEGLSGPNEDGSFVLDSVGDGACRMQTRVTPQGGLILVTVLYGAACPA